jgi:hypothetical protein
MKVCRLIYEDYSPDMIFASKELAKEWFYMVEKENPENLYYAKEADKSLEEYLENWFNNGIKVKEYEIIEDKDALIKIYNEN